MMILQFFFTVLVAVSVADARKRFEVLQHSSDLSDAQWQEKCREMGGRLASINNQVEQEDAKIAVSMKRVGALTGMKRIAPHKYFVNGDGQRLTYSNWFFREPNDCCGGEECIEVKSFTGQWNDIKCKKNAALCEYIPKTFKTLSNGKVKLSYSDWQKKCSAHGGRLARINTAKEQTSAHMTIKSSGKYSFMLDFKRASSTSQIFQNSDGEPILYFNWNKGEPNNDRGVEQCTEIFPSSGKWNDIPCKLENALCEIETIPKKHYIVVEYPKALGFESWKILCRMRRASLATINNAQEQKEAEKALKTTKKTLIMIGVKRESPNSKTFVNTFGQKVSYFNWNKNEPNNCCGGEPCVEIRNTPEAFGKWNDIKCSRKVALCETV